MNLNFELILFYATVVSGVIAGLDCLFFAKRRQNTDSMPWVFDYARSFFPILLTVFFLRSFLYEPFRIPSGSLKPTLKVGDFVLVNKFIYGIRLPVWQKKLLTTGSIKRGDILVFHYPLDPSLYFIKRVIGLPGDRISYINKELFVNGQKMPQVLVKDAEDEMEDSNTSFKVEQWQENLAGVSHAIFKNPARSTDDFENRVVPNGQYFVMGDNRDNSEDSRAWGFVPDKNVVGRASLVWMSWDSEAKSLWHKIRWDRIGRAIH